MSTPSPSEATRPSVHAMNRKELEAELIELGASYSTKQLVPELRELLKATRESLGLKGPARGGKKAGMIPSLSGLSKPQLIARAVLSGIQVNPVWTAGKLMTEIRAAEMDAIEPLPSHVLKFGKHQEEKYWNVRERDPQYCQWVLEQGPQGNPDFEHFRKYLLGPPGEDPNWTVLTGGKKKSTSEGGSSGSGSLIKEEPNQEMEKLKEELASIKQEIRAKGQSKRIAQDAEAMPVETQGTQEALTEIVSFMRGMAHRIDQLEKK